MRRPTSRTRSYTIDTRSAVRANGKQTKQTQLANERCHGIHVALRSANAPRSPGSRYLRHTRLRDSDIVRALFLCNEQLVELSQ